MQGIRKYTEEKFHLTKKKKESQMTEKSKNKKGLLNPKVIAS